MKNFRSRKIVSVVWLLGMVASAIRLFGMVVSAIRRFVEAESPVCPKMRHFSRRFLLIFQMISAYSHYKKKESPVNSKSTGDAFL